VKVVEGMGEGVVKGDKSQGEKPCDATTNWRRRSERSWCDEAMEGDERGRGRATRQPTNDRLRRDQVEAVEGIERDYARATVVFLYLVPRGLRLIRSAVWPTPSTPAAAAAAAGGGGGDVDVDGDDRGDGGSDRGGGGDWVGATTTTNATMAPATMMIADDGRTPSKEDEGMSRETATTTRSVANWVR